MTENEVQEVLNELSTVRPEKLNESGKRLFYAIMKISDERDKANNIINELEKRLVSDKKFFEDVYKKSHLSEEEFRKQCPYTIGSYDHSVEMLGKLQKLKGSD